MSEALSTENMLKIGAAVCILGAVAIALAPVIVPHITHAIHHADPGYGYDNGYVDNRMKIKIEKYLRKKVNEISKQSPGKSQQNNGKFNDRNLIQIQELTTKFNELKNIKKF